MSNQSNDTLNRLLYTVILTGAFSLLCIIIANKIASYQKKQKEKTLDSIAEMLHENDIEIICCCTLGGCGCENFAKNLNDSLHAMLAESKKTSIKNFDSFKKLQDTLTEKIDNSETRLKHSFFGSKSTVKETVIFTGCLASNIKFLFFLKKKIRQASSLIDCLVIAPVYSSAILDRVFFDNPSLDTADLGIVLTGLSPKSSAPWIGTPTLLADIAHNEATYQNETPQELFIRIDLWPNYIDNNRTTVILHPTTSTSYQTQPEIKIFNRLAPATLLDLITKMIINGGTIYFCTPSILMIMLQAFEGITTDGNKVHSDFKAIILNDEIKPIDIDFFKQLYTRYLNKHLNQSMLFPKDLSTLHENFFRPSTKAFEEFSKRLSTQDPGELQRIKIA